MRKKLISTLAVGALLLGGLTALAACGQKPSNPSNDSSAVEGTKYAVTYNVSADFEVTGLKDAYAEGEVVTFKIDVKDAKKQIGSVRYIASNSKNLRPKNGEYSFEMPAEEVRIDITIVDADLPVLTAFYSGNPVVGETLTITTKIDFADNDSFNVTAKTGASLVQITGHQVKLVGTGAVVLEITAEKDGDQLKTEISFTVYESEAGLGTNIAYNPNQLKAGGESNSPANPGVWVYWSGDGGNISKINYDAAKDEFEVNYSMGWAWYGVQLFYTLPYAQAGDNYKIRWEVESDVAGKITISGNQIDLKVGSNLIALDLTQGTGATISLQMGIVDTPLEGGTVFTFKPVRIYDADSSHTYSRVTFALDGNVMKDIYVRNGQKVSAPEVEPQEGKIFTGFFDGETKYDENATVSKNANYVARFVNKTAENSSEVKLMLGEEELTTVSVYNGNKLLIPSGLNYGFGKQLKGLYTNKELTTPFSLDTAINGDLVLYVKTQIAYEASYVNDGGLGYKIPNEWIINNDDGSVTLKFNGWGSDQLWHIQANFTDSLIRGKAGERYTISFSYSMNLEGADAQIYDGSTLDRVTLDVGNKQTASLSYDGGTHTDDFKLTFELGGLPLDQEVIFTLHDISIAKN